MKISQIRKNLKKILPQYFLEKIHDYKKSKDRQVFLSLPNHSLNLKYLRENSFIDLSKIFSDETIAENWIKVTKKIDCLSIPEQTGGVNLGDRKAIFYIIAALKPKSVLEIGTHIGASTTHIACALFSAANASHKELVSVDIIDVNCPIKKPWLEYKSKFSPKEMINDLGFPLKVEFVINNSIDFFKSNQKKIRFDIFGWKPFSHNLIQRITLGFKRIK